ncbi:MAG: RnfH family protein, partial [Hydrogenophaga sp.]
MKIHLAYSPTPRVVHHEAFESGGAACTVAQALTHSGWLVRFPEIQAAPLRISIWGRWVGLEKALR